jgi:hypothetical protein
MHLAPLRLTKRDRKVALGAFASEWIDSTLAASERKASTKPCHPAHLMHSCASQSVFNTLAMSSGVVLCGQCCGVK